jgi:hypothetical protein
LEEVLMVDVLESAKEKAQDYGTYPKLTKDEFLEAMRSGWRRLRYTKDYFYRAKNGYTMSPSAPITQSRERIASCCALGAAAYALEVSADRLREVLPTDLCNNIACVSNKAGSKAKAIRDVTQVVEGWTGA